ncbi:hypothetical protein MMC16_006977 [Acarospora aff. strigata]|nr:hypothetical protein [Acarospora aff. strigata]
MDMSVNVPIDNPDADTEWNDILRKHGVIPEKPPSPTPVIEEAIHEVRRLAVENRLEGKDLGELDELEDEEDEVFLEKYRQQRFAELATISTASTYNQVYHLQKPDYARDVTEASHKSFVLVHLTSSLGTNIESRLLTELWRDLAFKYGDIKFCEIRADMCIEGYPEKNTPTILIYSDGDIKRQIITLKELGGQNTTAKGIEKLLLDIGAIKSNDHRFVRKGGDETEPPNSKIRKGALADDDDDDWD